MSVLVSRKCGRLHSLDEVRRACLRSGLPVLERKFYTGEKMYDMLEVRNRSGSAWATCSYLEKDGEVQLSYDSAFAEESLKLNLQVEVWAEYDRLWGRVQNSQEWDVLTAENQVDEFGMPVLDLQIRALA